MVSTSSCLPTRRKQLKPMAKEQRRLVHAWVAFYGLVSRTLNTGAHPAIELIKSDHAYIPDPLLTHACRECSAEELTRAVAGWQIVLEPVQTDVSHERNNGALAGVAREVKLLLAEWG